MDLKKILPENGPPIDQVSKYIEKYKNDLIVIKYGGNVLIDRNIFNNWNLALSHGINNVPTAKTKSYAARSYTAKNIYVFPIVSYNNLGAISIRSCCLLDDK